MTHYTTPAASQFFTITQTALGSPLQFEPAVGSKELDSMIHSYLPGPGSISQKRGRVVVDFLDSIERLGFPHPVCLRYFVPTVPMSQSASPASTPADVKTSTPLKRQREESTEPASDARRLPGFSILTKDGVDITEYASRGPKTKEQREHAALMRKLKACAACKRSKQRCDPSHHRPASSALAPPSSRSSSTQLQRNTSASSGAISRTSTSPLSSLGESFTSSPMQYTTSNAVAHTGQDFNFWPTPSDFSNSPLGMNSLDHTSLGVIPEMDAVDPYLFEPTETGNDPFFGVFSYPNPAVGWEQFSPQDFSGSALESSSSVQTQQSSLLNPQWVSNQGTLTRESGYDGSGTTSSPADVVMWSASKSHDALTTHPAPHRHARPVPGTLLDVPGAELSGSSGNMPALERAERILSLAIKLGGRPSPHLARDFTLYPDAPLFDFGLEDDQIYREVTAHPVPPPRIATIGYSPSASIPVTNPPFGEVPHRNHRDLRGEIYESESHGLPPEVPQHHVLLIGELHATVNDCGTQPRFRSLSVFGILWSPPLAQDRTSNLSERHDGPRFVGEEQDATGLRLSPLMLAASKGFPSCVDILLEYKGSCGCKNKPLSAQDRASNMTMRRVRRRLSAEEMSQAVALRSHSKCPQCQEHGLAQRYRVKPESTRVIHENVGMHGNNGNGSNRNDPQTHWLQDRPRFGHQLQQTSHASLYHRRPTTMTGHINESAGIAITCLSLAQNEQNRQRRSVGDIVADPSGPTHCIRHQRCNNKNQTYQQLYSPTSQLPLETGFTIFQRLYALVELCLLVTLFMLGALLFAEGDLSTGLVLKHSLAHILVLYCNLAESPLHGSYGLPRVSDPASIDHADPTRHSEDALTRRRSLKGPGLAGVTAASYPTSTSSISGMANLIPRMVEVSKRQHGQRFGARTIQSFFTYGLGVLKTT